MTSPLLRLPPLDPLRGFVAAARHLSFTRAAEELCLTQSAISRQIQALETGLGIALFERGTRRLALTRAGALLFREAEAWLFDYAALAARLREDGGRRPVTVTTAIGIAALWLVPRLARFHERHPDIDVRLATSNRVVDLAHEDVDLALRFGLDRDIPPGARRLFGESVVPVAAPAVAARDLDARTLPDSVLLDFDDARFPWLRWDDWLAALGLSAMRPRAMLAFNQYDQLIQAAVAGQGIAIGRVALVAPLLADGRLAVVGNRRREVAGRGYWLIAAPGPMRPEVSLFADWVAETAAQTEAPTVGNEPGR